MTDRPRDPLANTSRLIVDGTNLLYAMSHGPERQPPAALIGRLRAIIPAGIAIDLVFDGPAEPGLRGERIASGVRVRYSGARSADSVILTMVDEAGIGGLEAAAGILVVTDDRDLRNRLRVRGARTAGATWLMGRLDRGKLMSPAAGNRKPARNEPFGTDEDRPGWKPGRGATVKRGPSRRGRGS
ncbi:MAG TPA: NYN domain-containing protein [Candidatus Limnocylindrales bacterium]|nr:NYN domain-containing protein [Candidatus Limnocylindrales bacterium]